MPIICEPLWNGEETQPVTANPEIESFQNNITIRCATQGASIGYKIVGKDKEVPRVWSIYQDSFEIPDGASVMTQAYRIGYESSEIVKKDCVV